MKKFSRLYPKATLWLENAEKKVLPPLDTGFLQTIKLDMVDHLIIYGIGNGELYQELKGWLRKKRRRLLILIEPDLEVLKNFLESKLGKETLREERVQLHYFEPDDLNMNLFQRLMWLGWEKKIEVIKDPRYDQDRFQQFKDMLSYDVEKLRWFGFEFVHYGVGYYVNFYQNLKSLPSSFNGVGVFDKAKGIPAFIIGAGPSLNKNGPLLKKIGNHGIIFAGGSSIQALATLGLKPHFAAGIDPNIWLKERFKIKGSTDVPFFYRLRINNHALEAVEGPKLYISGSGVYRTVNWIEEQLHLQRDDIDEGFNVINFLTNIAMRFGCDPIVYVGLDLSYTDSAAYAKGIEWPNSMPTDVIEGIDIEGNPVLTRWMWLKESHWISIFAKDNPSVEFINATEGGIGFENVPNENLEDVLEQVLTDQEIPKEVFEFKPLNVKYEDILGLIEKLSSSLDNISVILNEMKQFYENLKPEDFKEDAGDDFNWTIRLQEEPAFDAILQVFDEFFLQLISNSHLFYLIQRDGMAPKRAKKVIDYQLERLSYLEKVILVQKELIHKFITNQ